MASGKPLLSIDWSGHVTLSAPCVWLLIGAIAISRAVSFCGIFSSTALVSKVFLSASDGSLRVCLREACMQKTEVLVCHSEKEAVIYK